MVVLSRLMVKEVPFLGIRSISAHPAGIRSKAMIGCRQGRLGQFRALVFAAARKAAEEVPKRPDDGRYDQQRQNAATPQGSHDPHDY